MVSITVVPSAAAFLSWTAATCRRCRGGSRRRSGGQRLGSNSLTELLVFGKVAGDEAAAYSKSVGHGDAAASARRAADTEAAALALHDRKAPAGGKGERIANLRRELAKSMEDGCGIYRTAETMQATCDKLAELKSRYKSVVLDDRSRGWNTEWLLAIELGFLLDVAQAMAHSALARRESRGSHQRLDGFTERDDANYLQHSLATYAGDAPPVISYGRRRRGESP